MVANACAHRKHPDTGAANHLKLSAPGAYLAKTPLSTFDKIFDKPQPLRVQRPQILASMLTVSRPGTGFLRGLTADNAIARGACCPDIDMYRVKFQRAVMSDETQQSSAPVFRSSLTGN